MADEAPPLRLGHVGPGVAELRRRLQQADFAVDGDDDTTFGEATDAAVRAFQRSRGIEVDGVCGRQTWGALAEAAYHLGDRLLYLQRPMLRGDDVAELQRRLGALGFDAGRVDGILGPDTARALENFQRNAGLPTDSIFGPDSLAALNRLGGREHQPPVTAVREREHLLSQRGRLGERWILVGERGGLGTVVDTIVRRLRARGVRVETIMHPDGSAHARLANELDVDLYLGVRADEAPETVISYFETEGFTSPGGAVLGAQLGHMLTDLVDGPLEVMGRRIPVLRETRMTAIDVRVGPAKDLLEKSSALAELIADAVVSWLVNPAGSEDQRLDEIQRR